MALVRLKGLNRVSKRLKDGRRVTYWYAWKGGPKLEGEPGTPEFVASYNAAVQGRRAPRNDTLAGLVKRYRASPEYQGMADSTRAEWGPWLDRIERDEPAQPLDIGGLPLAALADARVREDLLAWRDQFAATRRKADYAKQVLSRVLGWSVKRGILAFNPMAGTENLYANNRADQIWTDAEREAFQAAAPSPEVAFIPELACLTGLRREDLTKVAWAHAGDVAIVMSTGKSGEAAEAVVPIIPALASLLDQIRAQQAARHAELVAAAQRKRRPPPEPPTTILSNTRGKAWSVDGLEHQVIDTKKKAGVDKHLHDCRGTFATQLRLAGLTASEIADILAWEEDRVLDLLKKYVDRRAIVKDIAERLSRNKPGA